MSNFLKTTLGIALLATASAATLPTLVGGAAGAAAALAAAIAGFNGAAALVLAEAGSRSTSTRGFFAAVFGGMVLRMGLTLGAFVAAVRLLALPATPFAVSLLAFTGLFMAAELRLWSRQNFSPRSQLS